MLHGRHAVFGGLLGDAQLSHELQLAGPLVGELVGTAVMAL